MHTLVMSQSIARPLGYIAATCCASVCRQAGTGPQHATRSLLRCVQNLRSRLAKVKHGRLKCKVPGLLRPRSSLKLPRAVVFDAGLSDVEKALAADSALTAPMRRPWGGLAGWTRKS